MLFETAHGYSRSELKLEGASAQSSQQPTRLRTYLSYESCRGQSRRACVEVIILMMLVVAAVVASQACARLTMLRRAAWASATQANHVAYPSCAGRLRHLPHY